MFTAQQNILLINNITMENQLFNEQWQDLAVAEIMKKFRENFPSAKNMPNMRLVKELQSLRKATIKHLENRAESTVYQIAESGTVYQMLNTGMFDEFESYEEYKQAKPLDAHIR